MKNFRKIKKNVFTCVATSPMTAVSIPMINIETKKHTQPPAMPSQ